MPRFRFTDGERHIFRKRGTTPLSEWAARNVIVKDGPFAGGRYRRSVNPYLVGIMDAWGDPVVKEIIVCGSAQTGKSLVLHAALCYSICNRPGPRMLAMQDDDTIAKILEGKLKPMFRATVSVRKLLANVRAKKVRFRDGTVLYLASAQSQGQRASISIQDLFIDEEALYKQVAGQGVPVLEFLERTRSYDRKRKVLRVSKPIGGDDCTIARAIESECDEVRRFEVACPACGYRQIMTEDGIVTAEKTTNPQDVERRKLGRYRCAQCRFLWTDYLRDRAVSSGRWLADEPVPFPKKIGFWLPAVLSSSVSISEIAAAKMRAEQSDSPALRQQYANGFWARPYRAIEIETTEEQILDRRDKTIRPRVLPADVIALTAGIDVQKRGFWFVVSGWREDFSSVLVDYGRLPDWDSVDALVHQTRYEYESDGPKSGKSLPIWRAAMDSGGTRTSEDVVSRTEEVYNYVRLHGAGRVFACKGLSHESHTPVRPTNIDKYPSSRKRIPGGLWLYLLDTHYFKSLLFARLHPDARQPMTLHAQAGEDYARQLTAEVLVKDQAGKAKWVRKRKDNHLLDCTMMSHACVDGSWLPSLAQMIEFERERQAAVNEARAPMGASDASVRAVPMRSTERNLPSRGAREF